MRTFAQPVAGSAGLEFRNTVVLGAEGDEGSDGRAVASLNVGAEKLAALGESYCVDCGRGGEDVVAGEVGADFVALEGDVAEEGCSLTWESVSVRDLGI